MANGVLNASTSGNRKGTLLMLLALLVLALGILCHEDLLPHRVFWANDMPLGALKDPSDRLPATFWGHWGIMEYIGGPSPTSAPSFTMLLQTIFTPETFLKIYPPLTMLILGMSVGFFFLQMRFAPAVCFIAGLGAALNMHFFSNACWGLGQWSISAAMVFTSAGILLSPNIRSKILKAILCGLAVGMAVMEGFDVGAILSLYVGAFIVFYILIAAPTPAKGIPTAIGMGTLVVLAALLISGSTLYTLVGTQISGKVVVGANEKEREQNWNFTTQWSFPKAESVRLFIPGVYGYRLVDYITDTNKASAYWGNIAEDPHIDQLESPDPKTRMAGAASLGLQPAVQELFGSNDTTQRENVLDQIKGFLQRRHTGSGDYTGFLVCLLAVFGMFISWRRRNSPFTHSERQQAWFWAIVAIFSLMAAWGRYGSVYQFVYRLPFVNHIRNPIKFLHPLNIALIALSGFGLEALYRRYLTAPLNTSGLSNWWNKTTGFDKKWVVGMGLAFAICVFGWFVMQNDKTQLAHHFSHNGFSEDIAPQMAAFSIKEVGVFLLFFAASAAVLTGIISGLLAGKRAKAAWVLLGLIMFCDLVRADMPWVRVYDYEHVYSMNPVVDFLRKEPWEHRVMSRVSPTGTYLHADGGNPMVGSICHWWLENDYLANDIESMEIDQAPRLPDFDRSYIEDFLLRSPQDWSPVTRMWRLTNTRYIFADASLLNVFNQLGEPKNSFRYVMRMDIVRKPGVEQPRDAGDLTVQTNENGPVALMEYTAALPRAKLFANWQPLGDEESLQKLNSPDFDPAKTVLIATDTPTEKPSQPDADPGTVKIIDYQPKYLLLEAEAKVPAVMLLNDHTGQYWNLWIDKKPAPILRLNYTMRGCYVTPGHHTIEFRFQPPIQWQYVSFAALGVGVLLTGFAVVGAMRKP